MNKRIGLPVLAACWLSVVLGGCGGLLTSDRPAETTWWLEPLAPVSAGTAIPGGLDLELEVSVVPGLDTDRILTLGPGAQLSHLAGARWADNLPDVLESVLSRSFQPAASGASHAAEEAGQGRSCRVRLEIQEFFARLDRAGDVESTRIAFDANIECGGRGKGTSAYHDRRPVPESSRENVVAALQQGLNALMRTLRTDLYNLANANQGSG